jgi:hypothetical protein
MEPLRKEVALRLREIADPERAGIRRTIPSVAEFGAASDGRLRFDVGWWSEGYTQLGGRQIRQLYQSADDAETFRDNHPGLVESLHLAQSVPTFGGNSILVLTDAYRFDGPDQTAQTVGGASRLPTGLKTFGPLLTTATDVDYARRYFDLIEAHTQASADTNPDFTTQPVEPPPGAPSNLTTKWLLNGYTFGSGGRSVEARGWLLNTTEVAGLGIAGPPRSDDENDDAVYVAALFGIVTVALTGYDLWNSLNDLAEEVLRDRFEQVFGEFSDWCGDYDSSASDD